MDILEDSDFAADAQDLSNIIKSLRDVEVSEAIETTVQSTEAHDSLNLKRMCSMTLSFPLMLMISLKELYFEHRDVSTELHDNDLLDRQEEEPRGDKAQRRRLKQRERRQRWRREKQKDQQEREDEPIIENKIPADAPASVLHASENKLRPNAISKRHRRSPHERTMEFFSRFYESDTRPADWILVCDQKDEYARFPYHCTDPPLSQLSGLVWEVEYAMKRLGSLSFRDVSVLEQLAFSKTNELTFFRKHLERVKGIRGVIVKHANKHGFDSVEDAYKKVQYGYLVLSRVVPQLKIYQLELIRRLLTCRN